MGEYWFIYYNIWEGLWALQKPFSFLKWLLSVDNDFYNYNSKSVTGVTVFKKTI